MAVEDILKDYQSNYGAGDKDYVLSQIQKYGTADRSQWNDQPEEMAQAGGPQGNPQFNSMAGFQQPQVQGPPNWDRTAFRDQWMSSGIQNVPDMQNWLKRTGWNKYVGAGGSKGDVFMMPGGEAIDAVLAAGLGGNRGGPQWTGKGNWMGGGMQQMASPSPNMYSQLMGNMSNSPYASAGMQQQGQPSNRMMGGAPRAVSQRRMNPTTGQSFQSRTFGGQPYQQQQQNRMF